MPIRSSQRFFINSIRLRAALDHVREGIGSATFSGWRGFQTSRAAISM
jgi:hypothetical protein